MKKRVKGAKKLFDVTEWGVVVVKKFLPAEPKAISSGVSQPRRKARRSVSERR